MGGSLTIVNETEFPQVVSFGHVCPLYWAILKPGERKSWETGRVWFTVWTEVYNGNNEPTALGSAAKIGAISVATIATVATLGTAGAGYMVAYEGGTLVSGAIMIGTTTAAVTEALITGGVVVTLSTGVMATIENLMKPTKRMGIYADGKTVRIRGGYERGTDANEPRNWSKMHIYVDDC